MATKEARARASLKYDKAKTVQVHLKFNKMHDADILARLAEVGNKQGYIKQLIRADMIE